MPWKVTPVSETRLAFVHQVLTLRVPVSQACRSFGISRKTGYKWLDRYRSDPQQSLHDRPRRPLCSPNRTAEPIEQRILEVRREFGWGARKIRAYLADRGIAVPSPRTISAILSRNGLTHAATTQPQAVQFFERSGRQFPELPFVHGVPAGALDQVAGPFALASPVARLGALGRGLAGLHWRSRWHTGGHEPTPVPPSRDREDSKPRNGAGAQRTAVRQATASNSLSGSFSG